MKLIDAARRFDDIDVYDAYTGDRLFKAQVSSFMDSQVDGTISRRRIMSCAPDLVAPTRRAVSYLGETWVIGDAINDGIFNAAIRKSFGMKKASGLYAILTPGEAALGSAGTLAYAQAEYLKDLVNSQSDSGYDPFLEIHFGSNEAISKGKYLRLGSTLYRTRSAYALLEGFICSSSDELDAGTATAVTLPLSSSTYDPVTDVQTSVTVNTTGLLLDMIKLYDYKAMAAAKLEPGDKTLVTAQSAGTPKVGAQLTVCGATWRILAVNADQDAWNSHLRRVG